MKVETAYNASQTGTRLKLNLNYTKNELGAFALFPTLFGIIHGINSHDYFEPALHPDVKSIKAYSIGKGISMALKVMGLMFLLKLFSGIYKNFKSKN